VCVCASHDDSSLDVSWVLLDCAYSRDIQTQTQMVHICGMRLFVASTWPRRLFVASTWPRQPSPSRRYWVTLDAYAAIRRVQRPSDRYSAYSDTRPSTPAWTAASPSRSVVQEPSRSPPRYSSSARVRACVCVGMSPGEGDRVRVPHVRLRRKQEPRTRPQHACRIRVTALHTHRTRRMRQACCGRQACCCIAHASESLHPSHCTRCIAHGSESLHRKRPPIILLHRGRRAAAARQSSESVRRSPSAFRPAPSPACGYVTTAWHRAPDRRLHATNLCGSGCTLAFRTSVFRT
jgi:hypothetical protein